MGGYAWQDGEMPGSRPNMTAATAGADRLAVEPLRLQSQWGVGLGATYRSELFPNINNARHGEGATPATTPRCSSISTSTSGCS